MKKDCSHAWERINNVSFRSNLTEAENILFKMSSEMFQDDVAEAVEDLTRAIALEPDNAESFYGRGLCHALAGDTHEALADYAQTLALDPVHPKAAQKRDELLKNLNEH
jgi:Flp pilus assembly protein TadD